MKKTKKIDVITKYFFPQDGGIERSILETYSRLANNGFRVTVHTSTNTYEKGGVLPDKSKMKRLKIRRYPKVSFDFLPKISYFQTDFLVLHNFNILPHGLILAISLFLKLMRQKNFKLVISPHGGMTPNYSNFRKIESILKKCINYVLIKVLVNNTADRVRIVSKWEENACLKLGLKPSLLLPIPDGIDNEAFAKRTIGKVKTNLNFSLPAKYVIQIGKIYPTKKYETVIKSLKYMTDKTVNLIIVGRVKDRSYFNSLKELSKKEGLEKRVHFIHFVSVAQKYRLLAKSQAFIMSSDWESFGRVTFEALSQGVVVIVSDKTAPSLLVNNEISGFKFNNNNPKELSRLISEAIKIKSSSKIRSVKAQNEKYAQKYSWNNISKEFVKMFADLHK